MKAEPLKGKGKVKVGYPYETGWYEPEGYVDDIMVVDNVVVFPKEDIRSAVEWLKQEIPNIVIDLLSEDEKRIMKKIDEAFEDVMK